MNRAPTTPIRTTYGIACFLVAMLVLPLVSQAETSLKQVEGLWAYTGLTSSGGQSMPLTGIFLFRDGAFIQQAVFNGEPYFKQGAMAHSGPYSAIEGGVHLVAEQTLSLSPADPLSSHGVTEHDLDVTRVDDGLTLVFGSGTVQTLRRIGDASDATIVALEDGMMALVDDHFIVVSGDDSYAVTGYGRYHQAGERYFIDVIRWVETDGKETVSARSAVITAHFDGKSLRLPGGRVLKVDK
ncbi:hypothetical protein [Kineobactrum salinum]|uniref:Lipocalin-like domain-containing protein n=1 Tax=Kineobactrum salinum TaxID=2708301 RepID=A0A6C0TZL0_9GAMM|nr:hypothetical protein [Kineobactrum salinum]QIB64137.1 hypothetical protein G3T16_00600 [Kineobactrum salinum]